jgi:hypothetical protein
MAVNLVSMTARSFGTVKSGNRAPKLVAMTEVTSGKDAGNGLQIFCRDAQDHEPRCGLAPHRKSALRSFRCRLLVEERAAPVAVNIRGVFEKCKPRCREIWITDDRGRSVIVRASRHNLAWEVRASMNVVKFRHHNEKTAGDAA